MLDITPTYQQQLSQRPFRIAIKSTAQPAMFDASKDHGQPRPRMNVLLRLGHSVSFIRSRLTRPVIYGLIGATFVLSYIGVQVYDRLTREKCPQLEETCTNWISREYPAGQFTQAQAYEALASREGFRDLDKKQWYDMVLIVPSGAKQIERRASLRKQYERSKKLTKASTKLIFAIGEESRGKVHGEPDDIIYVNCRDHDGDSIPLNGSSTTCKIAKSLVHIVDAYNFHFLARVGDDAYFRFDQFFERIAPRHIGDPLVLSYYMNSSRVPEQYPHLVEGYKISAWPSYPGGMGYVFGYKVAAALADMERGPVGLKDGWPEDGVVGMWLLGLKYTRVHTPCFHNHAERIHQEENLDNFPRKQHFLAAPCTPNSLLIHYMTPALWGRIDDRGQLRCGQMLTPDHCVEERAFYDADYARAMGITTATHQQKVGLQLRPPARARR